MATSLKQTAADLVTDPSVVLPKDREAAADVLAKMIRDRHDTSTLRGSQDAARRALGLPSTAATFDEFQGEVDKGDRTKARRIRKTRKAAAKAARRRGVRSLGTSGASSPGGLVAQALGLVVLYFLLRNASTAAELLGSVRRGVEWIMTPVPFGGRTP
jgi:hypothetical protein